jgi:4-diphosphocytidyl-2-C-methyl-D-erythritol kinase
VTAAPTTRVDAPAKVNLFLEILGRRPDGYHTLSTVFQTVSLADELRVSLRADGEDRLRCVGARLPIGPENLARRAAEAFRCVTGSRQGHDLRLLKRVPVGAGLGGGSSDAAAVLKACWELSGRGPFRARRWVPAATRLGADVPFFLEGGLAEAGGIGERLRRLPVRGGRGGLKSCRFVLIFPRVFVSTKWVYSRLRFPLTKRRSNRKLKQNLTAGRSVGEWAPLLYNRLEDVVLPRVPEVARAKRALLQAGAAGALMSGSGSAVFGVCASAADAGRVLERVRSARWRTWVVGPIFSRE